ncbi:SDR family oxidoreductase [Ensifer sp. ENS06]|uniref:SDR family NAD(P)-dependent oxidoreductase n=1 Tax=Ensifer sp. ENS06 TaxID=2769276 RepID=UPI0013AEAC5B|nr:SDR family oxidoreductase [Ensifer sp. ENS06]MBD9624707.1 SDR family oxidoreductase [Ensifer sp. ENS06]
MSGSRERIALVTGARSGIGKACAEGLAREGFLVVGCDLRSDQVGVVPLDVGYEEDWQNVIAGIDRRYGRLDVLINAAGVSLDGDTIEHCSPETWSATFETNLTGPFLGMKHAIPLMRKRGEGVILNISSILANVADGEAAAYSASKGALSQLTKSVALDLARKSPGIRCNAILPGYAATPLLERWPTTAYVQRTPLGRLCRPEEVASLAIYLCGDAAAAVTGSEFAVDGGYTAQ